MLITNDFVMLNYPKTGSSFARAAIMELLAQKRLKNKDSAFFVDLMLPNIKVTGVEKPADQHGTFSQIPMAYRGLPVVSIIRNPYTRFVSTYEFRAWERWPLVPASILEEHFPGFPDLSFDDYIRLMDFQVIHGRMGGRAPQANVGGQTIQFIQMFFKNPDVVLKQITDEYLDSGNIFRDIADIHFLRQERLNDDLALFLARHGYSDEDVEYVRNREKVNVTRQLSPDRSSYWTPSSIECIKYKERAIFRILESKGIYYPDPEIIL